MQGLLNKNIFSFNDKFFTPQIKTSYKLKNAIYSVPCLKTSRKYLKKHFKGAHYKRSAAFPPPPHPQRS